MTLTMRLNDRAPAEHGRQCCGGEVDLLLEPLPVVPAVAVFGVGHVGLELARILARHDVELHLVDSRADAFGEFATLHDDPELVNSRLDQIDAVDTAAVAVALQSSLAPAHRSTLIYRKETS